MMTSLYEYPPKGWVFGIQVGFRRQGSCSLRSGSKALCAMGLGFIFGGGVYTTVYLYLYMYIYIYIYMFTGISGTLRNSEGVFFRLLYHVPCRMMVGLLGIEL